MRKLKFMPTLVDICKRIFVHRMDYTFNGALKKLLIGENMRPFIALMDTLCGHLSGKVSDFQEHSLSFQRSAIKS